MDKHDFARVRPLPVSALATLLLVSTSAWGQLTDNRFSGTISNDWSVGGNWVSGAPTSSSRAIIDTGNAAQLSGTATTGQLFIGAGSNGSLALAGGTLHVTSALVLANAVNGNGNLSVTGGALLDVGTLYLGAHGTATLTLSGSQFLLASPSWIGGGDGGSGANGSLVLTSGSTMNTSGILTVGDNASTGSITANGTSTLNTSAVVLANGVGSTANVSLSGGSTWVSSGTVTAGNGGTANVTITGGSSLIDNVGVIGSGGSTSATVNVSGAGSKWVNNTTLYVGTTGNGALVIDGGGNVTSAATFIGRQGTSNSTVTVNGTGSLLQAGSLTIGGDAGSGSGGGQGRLTLQGGACATASSVDLGVTVGSFGRLLINNGNMTASGRASIGNTGSGNLTIAAGGVFTDAGALVGHNAGSTGTANVSGAGSQWINQGVLYIGNVGNGQLTVGAGGQVSSTDGYVATESGSTSTAVIDGAGTAWINSGDFFVGHNNGANGSVRIANGGSISGVQGILGDLAGATGSMVVTGAGSTWSSTNDVNVGRLGNGNLTIADGGLVTGNRSYIANNAGSTGTVLLTGSGSNWTTGNGLYVGASGNGTLTVSDGATATASTINIASVTGATGVINIGAAPGSAAVAAGNLNTSAIVFGAGSGTLNLNHNASSGSGRYALGAAFSGSGTINQLAGDTLLSGNSAAFTGVTNVNGGSLGVNGTLGGTVNVGNGGTLLGSGTVGTTTVAAGGTLATDGASTLTVNGGLTLNNGATLRVATTPGAVGKVVVNGNAQLGGNLAIVAGSGDYSSANLYTLLSASGTVSGRFANVTNDFAFVTPTVSYTGNSVLLGLTRNDNSYASVTTSPNQATIGRALTQAAALGSTSAAFRTILSQIDTLSASQARTAFDSMSGRAFQGLSTLGLMGQSLQTLGQRDIGSGSAGGFGSAFAMERWLFASNDVDRFDYQYTAATMTDSANGVGHGGGRDAWTPVERGGAWAQIIGGHGNTRSDGNAPGYTNNGNGLLVGADSALDAHWSVGSAYHYGNTRLSYDTPGDSAKVESHQLAVYGRYRKDAWNFKAVAGYGRNHYGADRSILIGSSTTRASASYQGDEIGLYLEGSYRIDRGNYVVEPLLSLQGTLLRQDGFTESGAGALGLTTQAQTSRSAVSMLGARWQLPLAEGKLQSEWRAFWSHQWLDTKGGINASFQGAPGVNFQVAGLEQKRDGLVLGAGLAGKVSKSTQLFVDYNLGLNDLQTQHSISAGIKVKW